MLEKQINQRKIAKNCWLSRYKRSRENKINYVLLPPKNENKNQ